MDPDRQGLLHRAGHPAAIGYALLDSPIALAAWMLDHDTDSYYKIFRAFLGGPPSGNLTREHILDNVTMCWLTGTGASAARSYWEAARATALGAGQTPPPVTVPVGFSAFPGELFQAPRTCIEMAYSTLTYYSKPPEAATSPPGRSPSCSRTSFAPRSGRSARPHGRLG